MAHFDRAVLPGEEGKVTLTIDLKGYLGQVWKSANLISNDPQQPGLTLSLHGKVRPFIECRPSCFIRFVGNEPGSSERTIDLLTTSKPFKITRIRHDLQEKINIQVRTITPGQHYQLRVINRLKTENFSGTITCFTDHPNKPEIYIAVYNQLNG